MYLLQIANPTVLDPPGITFLRPVWRLITDSPNKYKYYGLGLNESEVDVYYTKYINNFKRALRSDEESIEQAVYGGLTPGKITIKF